MKSRNKLLLIGLVTVGIGIGTYFTFAGGISKVSTAYDTYKITEKKTENGQKITFDSSKGNHELSVKKGDEVKKGQVLFEFKDPSIKLEKGKADMQKKLEAREVALLQKQIDAAKQKLQKDKNDGAEETMLQAAEQEIEEQEAHLEMKKFEVEATNERIQANKEIASGLIVTSKVDGVIEEINKGGTGSITIRIAGQSR